MRQIELRPDHNYARPWIDDPTIPTALPRVQLFFSTEPSTDGPIQIDDQSPCNDRSTEAINWAPTMNTLIPERFECPQQSDTPTTTEQEAFIGSVRDLIDETRLAALCCELVCWWRLFELFIDDIFFSECLWRCLLAFIHSSHRVEALSTLHWSFQRECWCEWRGRRRMKEIFFSTWISWIGCMNTFVKRSIEHRLAIMLIYSKYSTTK